MAKSKPKPWPQQTREALNRFSDDDLKRELSRYLDRQWRGFTDLEELWQSMEVRKEAVETLFAAVRAEETGQHRRRRGVALETVYDTMDLYTSIPWPGKERKQSICPFPIINLFHQRGFSFLTSLKIFQHALATAVEEEGLENELEGVMRNIHTTCVVMAVAFDGCEHRALFHANDEACLMAVELATFANKAKVPEEQRLVETIVEFVTIAVELGYHQREFSELIRIQREKLLAILTLLMRHSTLRTREAFDYLLGHMQEILDVYPTPERFVEVLIMQRAIFPDLPLATLTAAFNVTKSLEHTTALLALTHDIAVMQGIVDAQQRWETSLPSLCTSLSGTAKRVSLPLAVKALAHFPPHAVATIAEKTGPNRFEPFVSALTTLPPKKARSILDTFVPETVEQYHCAHALRHAFPNESLAAMLPAAQRAQWNSDRACRFVRLERHGVSLDWLARHAGETDCTSLVARHHIEAVLQRAPSTEEVAVVCTECFSLPTVARVKKILRRSGVLTAPPATPVPAPLAVAVAARNGVAGVAPALTIPCGDLIPQDVDAAHVSAIIVWGFLMPTQQRTFLNTPMPERHVRSNASRKLNAQFSLPAYTRACEWLRTVGVVVPYPKSKKGEVLLMNLRSDSHVGQELINRATTFRRSFK